MYKATLQLGKEIGILTAKVIMILIIIYLFLSFIVHISFDMNYFETLQNPTWLGMYLVSFFVIYIINKIFDLISKVEV